MSRHVFIAVLAKYDSLCTFLKVLIELLPGLQIISLTALALVLETFQVRLKTTFSQRDCCPAKTSHLFDSRRIDVTTWSPAMRTLLLLPSNELRPLQLHDAFLANDFLTLIAHLCLVQLELVAYNTVINFVLYAQGIKESLFTLLIRFALRTLRCLLAPFDVLVEVLAVKSLESCAMDQNRLIWLTAIFYCGKVDLKIEVRHVKLFGYKLL